MVGRHAQEIAQKRGSIHILQLPSALFFVAKLFRRNDL
jgi:hypothetical protein